MAWLTNEHGLVDGPELDSLSIYNDNKGVIALAKNLVHH